MPWKNPTSILDLAKEANKELKSGLASACTDKCYPNIIFTDDIPSKIAQTAMEVNSGDIVPTFRPVYQGNVGGIGGYDLKSPADRAFAFDYNQNGKLDHIALYRPGTGIFYIIENTDNMK